MAGKKGGLGSGGGFNALFLDNSTEDLGSSGSVKLSLNDISPNRDQPRKTFEDNSLNELADSIRENGVIQPLLVRPMPDGSYRLVAGERRYRASRLAGLTEVPVTIRAMTDEEESVFSLIENLQREDLNVIEEAQGLKTLIDTYGLTQEMAAEKVGKSRSSVTNALRLLNLPTEISDLLRDGKISMGHSRALLSIEDEATMKSIADMIVKDGISVREVERLARKNGETKKSPEKRVKKRDKYFDEVELALSESLGRKIKIFVGKANKGTLEIEFFGKDDLEKLAMSLDE
ncbi:MAG: ParB/RepB/Spo0J family partition protein [Oscillospiraceae bacterium]